ncbi:MAG TPA: adenylate/guanylate cyclase domain-containing protein [Chthoniobacterales bacterium]|jgi:adenylate cyclase
MSGKRVWVISALALGASLTLGVLDSLRPYAYLRVCNLYRDFIHRIGRTTPANPNLVFLAIDAASANIEEDDIDQLFGIADRNTKEGQALTLMSHGFPWSRQVYGLVLERLVHAGAKVVIFDLMFPTPSKDDPAFREALDRYADQVVIASNFVDGTLTRPSDTLIPQKSPTDHRIGYANFWADDDDVVRRTQYRVTFEQLRDMKIRPDSERFPSLAAMALTKAGFAQDVPGDIDDHAMRFTSRPREGFPSHSLFEIFVPEYWKQNYQSGQFFRDKLVIVGAEGNWQHDQHQTPMGTMPGPEVQLNAINAALNHEFLQELSPQKRLVFCVGATAVALLLSLMCPLPLLRFALTAVLSLVCIGAGLICYNRLSLFLPMVAPVGALNMTVLLGLVYDFTSEHLEKGRLRRTLERYVSRDIVHEMINRPQEYGEKLGGVVRSAAVLFSDIRSYSTVVSQSEPQILVTQLNEYFTAMVQCVFECGGTLDKFIGDALMAVWGSLHSEGAREDAVSAVRAALLMRKRLTELNVVWRERGWPELRVGMGINYGEVVVGNIGSPQRMEFTVIGNSVNLSWRLQELTKQNGDGIIVSSSVAMLLADEFPLRPISALKTGPVGEAYEICEAQSELLGQGAMPVSSSPLHISLLTPRETLP